MRTRLNLVFCGETLSTWEIPSFFEINWGDLVAVPYQGKLKSFRICGRTETDLLLMTEEPRRFCV